MDRTISTEEEFKIRFDFDVRSAWEVLADSFGHGLDDRRMRQVIAITEDYKILPKMAQLRCIAWCKKNLDKFPNQKNYMDAVRITEGFVSLFPDCKICANSGQAIIQKNYKGTWYETSVTCSCERGAASEKQNFVKLSEVVFGGVVYERCDWVDYAPEPIKC